MGRKRWERVSAEVGLGLLLEEDGDLTAMVGGMLWSSAAAVGFRHSEAKFILEPAIDFFQFETALGTSGHGQQ
jgi:hypothetical protein